MSNQCKRYIGIWVDHKQTYIVYFENNISTLRKIESHFPEFLKVAEGSQLQKNGDEIISESKHEDKNNNYLSAYYDEIIALIETTDAIVIFGPGAAKRELLKRIQLSHLRKVKIIGIETVDMKTEEQITAYTKDFFDVK